MDINDKYLPLWQDPDYDTVIISGGRGSGKSFAVGVFTNDLTYEAKQKILMARFTLASAKDSIIPEFEEKIELLDSPYSDGTRAEDFEVTQGKAVNIHSQSEVFFKGLKAGSKAQTARLKSINGITCLVIDEGEEIPDDGDDTAPSTYDKIEDSIRLKGVRLRKIILWNPSDVHSFVYKRFFSGKGEDGKDLPIDFTGKIGSTLYIYTSYEDNKDNLAQSFLDKAEKTKETNPARHKHIYKGHPLQDVEGAHWKQSTMIDPFRVSVKPELKRCVTAIDPSVSDDIMTDGKKNDECGIIAAGQDYQNPPHYYIFADNSGNMSNLEWSRIGVSTYKNTDSDRLLAEKNQGGDLVKMNIRNTDKHIPVTLIHAKKSKIARAEPVAALYEEGRVHHVGRFPELEHEMTTYDGTGPSPNRYDAMVYALLDLSQNAFSDIQIRSL
jgi:PBSX family phage terminase large subunit